MFESQIRLITPSDATACSPFGAAGGNVSASVTHAGGVASLSTESAPSVSTDRTA